MTASRDPITAAVLRGARRMPYEQLYIDRPGPHEVRVRPVHVGLCHSDLHYIDGTHQTDYPEVLGHEAAGIVESVGSNVSTVAVGDHVVTSLTMFCGRCRYCVTGRISLCSHRQALRTRNQPALITADGEAVGALGGLGAFAQMVLVHENGVVTIPSDVPLPVAALFGCAVLTGIGAVTRSACVPPGATVAVVGCGGIGLAAIQGARIAGASRIIAVDLSEAKLTAAEAFGATDCVSAHGHVIDRVMALVPGGVDFSFEAVGLQATAELSFGMLAPGGVCTILGMIPDETPIRVPASALYFHERRLQGAFIGSSRFTVDVPQLLALYQQDRLKLDELITHRVPFESLGEGFELMKRGDALRVVMDMDGAPGPD